GGLESVEPREVDGRGVLGGCGREAHREDEREKRGQSPDHGVPAPLKRTPWRDRTPVPGRDGPCRSPGSTRREVVDECGHVHCSPGRDARAADRGRFACYSSSSEGPETRSTSMNGTRPSTTSASSAVGITSKTPPEEFPSGTSSTSPSPGSPSSMNSARPIASPVASSPPMITET